MQESKVTYSHATRREIERLIDVEAKLSLSLFIGDVLGMTGVSAFSELGEKIEQTGRPPFGFRHAAFAKHLTDA